MVAMQRKHLRTTVHFGPKYTVDGHTSPLGDLPSVATPSPHGPIRHRQPAPPFRAFIGRLSAGASCTVSAGKTVRPVTRPGGSGGRSPTGRGLGAAPPADP